MTGKRQIDRQRDSAFSLKVGAEDDKSKISGFYNIGQDRLLILTENAIYEVRLPDQIDPKRTLIDLKPLQQRVLNFGSDDEIVCRILLTAQVLFREQLPTPHFDHISALALAFDGLKDLIAMRQIGEELEKEQNRAWAAFRTSKVDPHSIQLPSITDLEVRCDAYLQKANHVVITMEAIARLFYGDDLRPKWVDSLGRLAAGRYGKDSPFAKYMQEISPFLLLIINARNSAEHESAEKKVRVLDFSMDEHGQIHAPSIEIIHQSTPLERGAASEFMKEVTCGLAVTFETLMAELCANNLQPNLGLPVRVWELPEDRRANKRVRFGYAAGINGTWAPLG